MTPASARDLQKLGHDCLIEAGAGLRAGFTDDAYREAGVRCVDDAAAAVRGRPTSSPRCARPPDEEVTLLREGQTLISFFYPGPERGAAGGGQGQGRDRHRDGHGAAHQPRAEDGRAVVDGEHRGLPRGDRGGQQLRPLLHRPGHRGGQGAARPRCWSSAPASRAWPRSARRRQPRRDHLRLRRAPRGGRAGRDRWARSSSSSISRRSRPTAPPRAATPRPSSPEFTAAQLEKFREIAPDMDIVITTALIPGRDAPELWTEDMVKAMKPGSGRSSTSRPSAAATAS